MGEIVHIISGDAMTGVGESRSKYDVVTHISPDHFNLIEGMFMKNFVISIMILGSNILGVALIFSCMPPTKGIKEQTVFTYMIQ